MLSRHFMGRVDVGLRCVPCRLVSLLALTLCLVGAAHSQTNFVGEQLLSGTADAWEPFVAADPNSSNVYAVWFLAHGPPQCPGCPSSGLQFTRSADRGVTWLTPVYCPYCVAGSKGQYDPTIKVVQKPAVGNPAPVYVMWMDWNSIAFSKSPDNGVTWASEKVVSGSVWADHPWFGMSADGKDVYAFWAKGDIYAVASHDYGVTWSTPLKINTVKNLYYYAEGVEVLADGTVVTAAAGYPCGKGTSKCTGTISYNVFVSTNRGASYTQSVVDKLYTGPQYMTDGLETVASDAAGTLVLMYTGAPSLGANNGVFVRQSVNEGVTWSAPIPLIESGITADGCYPAIVGGASGSFRATFFDTRTGEFNVWYRQSSDGGMTWTTEVKISDKSSGAPYKNATGFGAPYGDYSGISILSNGNTIAIFGESAPAQAPPGGVWMNQQ
jgi:hypothetical protein